MDSATFLLSPTEGKLTELFNAQDEITAITSSLPEERGSDIVLRTDNAWFYFNRKQIPHDFLASVSDGRMTRSTSQMQELEGIKRFITEGEWSYWPDGTVYMIGTKGRPMRTQWRYEHVEGIELDIEYIKGLPIVRTKTVEETFGYLMRLARWAVKNKHLGLYTRPSVKGLYYSPTEEELYLWILQSWKGIGVNLAERILKHFGGKIPLAWTCTPEELAKVYGLSLKTAKGLVDSLSDPTSLKSESAKANARKKKTEEVQSDIDRIVNRLKG